MTQTQAQIDKEFEEMLANLGDPDPNNEYDLDLARHVLRTVHERGDGFSVNVDESYAEVSITDEEGVQEDIFLQGDEAAKFIAEAEDLWNKTGYVWKDDAFRYLAILFTENLWN